jgi:hypothetical protein
MGDHCKIMDKDLIITTGIQTKRSRSQTRNTFLGRSAMTEVANEERQFGEFEDKIVTTEETDTVPDCTSHSQNYPTQDDQWDMPLKNPTLTHLTQQLYRMQDEMERLMITQQPNPQSNQRLLKYPSTVSMPHVNQQPVPIITSQQLAQVEEAYRSDARTRHELKVLRAILTDPDEAAQIVSKRVRYLAKANLLGWRAAEDFPPLADIAMLTPQESEMLQRKQLESVAKPPLPPAFQQNKTLTTMAVKIPTTDRLGKPIRNPNA